MKTKTTKTKAKTNKKEDVTQGLSELLNKQAPKTVELEYGEGENKLVVKVYPVIPFASRTELVKGIVEGVFFGDKDNIDSYMPSFLMIIQRFQIVSHFTDLKLPTNIDDLWCVLRYTTIYDDVVKIVGEDEIADIIDAANKTIETYRLYIATKNDSNEALNKLKDSFTNIVKDMPIGDLSGLITSVKDMIGGADLKDTINALTGFKDDSKDKN